MRRGPGPEPKLGYARFVRRFAWTKTRISYGWRDQTEVTVWLEHYWREQIQWTDGTWRDGISAVMDDDPRAAA